jgi:hypothetical protein
MKPYPASTGLGERLEGGNGSPRAVRIATGRKSSWVPQIAAETWPKLARTRSCAAVLVYVMLASRADRYTHVCYASRERVAGEIAYTERMVTTAYNRLVKTGLLERIRLGGGRLANEFKVLGLVLPKARPGGQNEQRHRA